MKTEGKVAERSIPADFPYESKFLEVYGSRMHYVEEGSGDPILFLHGNPTCSYLWRNILPYLIPLGRCIACDLIGMGKSDKPDLDYRFEDHAKYIELFIEKLGLQHITIIGHNWGAALGIHYAVRHETRMKGIAFMETVLQPFSWRSMGIVERFVFKMCRHPVTGPKMIIQNNFFVEKILPMMTARKLSDEAMDYYRRPYLHTKSRKPVYAWPNEIPIDGEPADMHRIVAGYRAKLAASSIPKLLLWGKPGLLIREKDVQELQASLKNLETADVGRGKHYLPEDQPDRIGEVLADWYDRLQSGKLKHGESKRVSREKPDDDRPG